MTRTMNYLLRLVLSTVLVGVNCKKESNFTIPELPLDPMDIELPDIEQDVLDLAVEEAKRKLEQLWEVKEQSLYNAGDVLTSNNPAWYLASLRQPNERAKAISKIATVAEDATSIIAAKYSLNPSTVAFGLPKLKLNSQFLKQACPFEDNEELCKPERYREPDGRCNNILHPNWGMTNRGFIRFLTSDYGDGVKSIRKSRRRSLPNARHVSYHIVRERHAPSKFFSHLAIAWGYIIFYDLVHLAQFSGFKGDRIKCCGLPSDRLHPECLPILMDHNDNIYGSSIKCLEYVRSMSSPRTGCTFGPREQVNQATPFLDASFLYGTSASALRKLRSFKDGLLSFQRTANGTAIPLAYPTFPYCRTSNVSQLCFDLGDPRLNWNPLLVAVHSVWLREHNRLAKLLRRMNPFWDDEKLFQETRKIVEAQIQVVTYKEFLPILLGDKLFMNYGLFVLDDETYQGYNMSTMPGVANVITTVFLAMLLSAQDGRVKMAHGKQGKKYSYYPIEDMIYAPESLYSENSLKGLIQGAFTHTGMDIRPYVSTQISRATFGVHGNAPPVDLMAVAIQQSRDHGIPTYIEWRELCRLKVPRNFDELDNIFDDSLAERFQRVYRRIQDIDVIPAVLAEPVEQGAMVGETLGCIIALQFRRLRMTDRFWFENAIPPSALTEEQTLQLKKASLGRIICDNVPRIRAVPPFIFLAPDMFLNQKLSCRDTFIQPLNYSSWKDSSTRMMERADIHLTDDFRKMAKEAFFKLEKASDSRREARQIRSKEEDSANPFLATRRIQMVNNQSKTLEDFTRKAAEKFQKRSSSASREDIVSSISSVSLEDLNSAFNEEEGSLCNEEPNPCDHTTPYRTISGGCNHLQYVDAGKAVAGFLRLLPAKYEDGISAPKVTSASGSPLPSPRQVSVGVRNDFTSTHHPYTLTLITFGQLVTRDVALAPINEGPNKEVLDCSACNSSVSVNPECLPIPLPPKDPYFISSLHKNTETDPICLPFTRSMSAQRTFGPREQLNQVTGFLDGSSFYGSNLCEKSSGLDAKQKSHLRVNSILYSSEDSPSDQSEREKIERCTKSDTKCLPSGFKKEDAEKGLANILTIFSLEHNRIAAELHRLNPKWAEDKIFRETRRIVIAELQHVTYKEFVPRVLGLGSLHEYGLRLKRHRYYDKYDSGCEPGVYNEFAVAASSIWHFLLWVRPFDEPSNGDHVIPEVNQAEKTSAIDSILVDLVKSTNGSEDQPSETPGSNPIDFRLDEDFISRVVQRGRDHGIAPYNEYRVLCGLDAAKAFVDLRREIPAKMIFRLAAVYDDVNDVDLMVGGLAESPSGGALVGPTLRCILGRQFEKVRACDRFWYETNDPHIRFSLAQLTSLRRITLSKIICHHSEGIDSILRHALDVHTYFRNSLLQCSDLPDLNLHLWREESPPVCNFENDTLPVGTSGFMTPCVRCTCTTEGMRCHSQKVLNCGDLLARFPEFDLSSDPACLVQCAHVLNLKKEDA